MLARDVVERLLRAARIEARRKPRNLIGSPHELVMSLDYCAAHWSAHHPGRSATAVQVGAYDGRANDPLIDAIHQYSWTAVLVEPQPKPFAALSRMYEDNPRVQPVNAAISNHDGTQPLYYFEPPPGVPEWAGQLASFDREHLTKHFRNMPQADMAEHLRCAQVPTLTFESLLTATGVTSVDVLQVDVEGYDLEILRMFDIPRRLPSIVQYEHKHLSRRDREVAAQLLIDSGYRVATLQGDTLAYRTA